MKKHICLIAIALNLITMIGFNSVFGQVITDSNWIEEVKTVTLTKNGVTLEQPILKLGSEDKLLLRYDVLGAEADNHRYRIQHCDSQWRIDQMQPYEFMSGFEEGPIENQNSSFTTLQDFVNYYQSIPNNGQFLISGNYVVTVFLDDNLDSILLTRRFCVTEESLKTEAKTVTPYDNGSIYERQEIDVTVSQNLDYHGDMVTPSLNPAYLKIMIQQNGRLDNMRELTMSGYEGTGLSYKNHQENIFYGGNTFRYFDISNIRTATYNVAKIQEYGGEWFAALKPLLDRSHKPFITETVLNGGMKVNVWDRDDKNLEADYVWVNFMLPMEYPYMNGSIHVVGDLTQWKLDENSRMEYDLDLKAYRLRLRLKQGYYAYQLLFVPVHEHEGQTNVLEGNHYETRNDYTIYVYYHSPNDRYDRLVSLLQMKGL